MPGLAIAPVTLTTADFAAIGREPRLVGLGVLSHYTVMPAAAWLVIRLFGLDAETAVGVVLVGATSAGTASNVISYLARGNVALSVTLTATASGAFDGWSLGAGPLQSAITA